MGFCPNDSRFAPGPTRKIRNESRLKSNCTAYVLTNSDRKDILVRVSKKKEEALLSYARDNVAFMEYMPDAISMPDIAINFDTFRRKAQDYGFPKYDRSDVYKKNLEYSKENTWYFGLRIGIETEKDLYDYLKPMEGRGSYIKRLIREDMERQEHRRKRLETSK